MKSNIEYYPCKKQYDKKIPVLSDDPYEVGCNNQDITITLSDNPEAVHNPMLFVCRDSYVLRVNPMRYHRVTVPTELKHRLRRCKKAELNVVYNLNSVKSFQAIVEHVYRFPLIIQLLIAPPQIEFSWVELRQKLTTAGYAFHGIISNAPFYTAIVYQEANETQPQKVYLIAYFDSRTDWLADEECFNNEPPLWFTEHSRAVSPLYTTLQIVKQLNIELNLNVYGFLFFNPNVTIVNAEDMRDIWDKFCEREPMQVNFCPRVKKLSAKILDTIKSHSVDMDPPANLITQELIEKAQNIIRLNIHSTADTFTPTGDSS